MLKKLMRVAAFVILPTSAFAAPPQCAGLPDQATLKDKLKIAVGQAHAKDPAANIGFNLEMWASLIAKDGTVCAVAFSGTNAQEGQWLGSRVISAQKAFTGNAFSLGNGNGPLPVGKAGFAISSANLYSATQPGGSLFGLQESNPVWSAGAYGDKMSAGGVFTGPTSTANYGTATDPMVGQIIGGVNVFGGALGLYDASHTRVGGIGVSGDTSCMDHIVAWYLRKALGYDNLKGVFGFASLYATDPGNSAAGAADLAHPDNIIFDITNGKSFSAYGHPVCKGASGVTLTNKQADALVRSLPSAIVK